MMGQVVTVREFLPLRAELRREGKRLVFTNGVFDILHRGHIEYLNQARLLGDRLFVGVNSDESTRRIKGEKRPIVPQNDRIFVLSNLQSVDYVGIFDEDTPYELISTIVPDILVKGADWSIDKVVGKDIVEAAGGRVLTIPFVADRSTTNIVQRIIERYC
ncbi:MAG: D-glycero-beta-D-manno-heptose 1-phosphate adenylyltransferase [Bacteroidota bacterium]